MKLVTMLLALFLIVPSFAFSADKTKPTVSSLSVSSSTINEGDTVTIKYKVKDSESLKKVELWRGKSKGNLGPIKTDTVSGKTVDGKFNDKPSPAGTYYYGIHVLDKADNLGYDNGALPVTVKARDTTKPTLVSFSVDRNTINDGDTVAISYKVKDSGGSGLNKIELWKGLSKGNLGPFKTDAASSDSKEGRFIDKPSPAGTYYYGIHVLDKADNKAYDNGALPVTVKARDITPPSLVSFSVDRSSINDGDTVTISYKVKDFGGSGLKKVELWKGASKDKLGPFKTDSGSSDAKDGKFTDKPSAGTSYYGIHVIDAAGNVGYDNGAKAVTVNSPNQTNPTQPNSAGFFRPLDLQYSSIMLDLCDFNSIPDVMQTHRGVDISVPDGKNVYAVANGKVVENHKANTNDHWNASLIVEHEVSGNKYYTYYAHISSNLTKDTPIYPGKLLGTVNLKHLHISVNKTNKSYWGYSPDNKKESCESIKNAGWLRFQDVFNLGGYSKK